MQHKSIVNVREGHGESQEERARVRKSGMQAKAIHFECALEVWWSRKALTERETYALCPAERAAETSYATCGRLRMPMQRCVPSNQFKRSPCPPRIQGAASIVAAGHVLTEDNGQFNA